MRKNRSFADVLERAKKKNNDEYNNNFNDDAF